MNTRSLYFSSEKIENEQPSLIKFEDGSTPKKQPFLTQLQPSQDYSTIQKAILLGSERTFKTIKKQKKKPKRPWTSNQDQLLKELVTSKGAKEWATISSYFEDRCGKQCRQRWHNHLRNGIRKGDWSYQEEWLLYLGVQAYGKRWSQISKMLEGRTQNTLKNHWNCKMNPKKKSFQAKLWSFIKRDQILTSSLTKCQSQLLKTIQMRFSIKKTLDFKKQEEDKDVQALFFEKVLRDFYEMKRQVYKKFELQMNQNERKIFDQNPMEWDMVESFGKIKHIGGQEKSFEEIQNGDEREIEISDEKSEMQCKDFGSDSVSYNMKIQQCILDISNMADEVFDGTDSEQSDESILNMRTIHQNPFELEKPTSQGFYSPLRQKKFQGIDLGESNTKKKLFQ